MVELLKKLLSWLWDLITGIRSKGTSQKEYQGCECDSLDCEKFHGPFSPLVTSDSYDVLPGDVTKGM